MVRSTHQNSVLGISNFAIDNMMMRYSLFVPRLYNFCKSLGFIPGKILPSRAFCSDESQGFPIILITKHFGSFPFNHGMVGGIVATDRHGPYAEHGKDLVIIQASHVGYDPDSQIFGIYRRLQTEHREMSTSCGKVANVLNWYLSEYQFAQQNIWIEKEGKQVFITIDNQLLDNGRDEGLFLNLDKLISYDRKPVESFSTSKKFVISDILLEDLMQAGVKIEQQQTIGNHLTASYFYFKRGVDSDIEGQGHLERNLLPFMASVVTSKAPLLSAAILNTQIEYDRTFRTIVKNRYYAGKKVIFISGINIDISPQSGQVFPLTKFIPWAAYIQEPDGTGYTIEQQELMEILVNQPTDNPDQINLEDAINEMVDAQEVIVNLP